MSAARRTIGAVVLAVALCATPVAVPVVRAQPASPLGLVATAFHLGSAWSQRNRVYGNANAVEAEQHRSVKRQQLAAVAALQRRDQVGLRKSQLAQYVKVYALLNAERTATDAFLEAKKRAAAAGFKSALQDALVQGLQQFDQTRQLVTGMRDALGRARTLVDELRAAAEAGTPSELLLGRVKAMAAELDATAGLVPGLGGRAGQALRQVTAPVSRWLASVDAAAQDVARGASDATLDLDRALAAFDRVVTPSIRRVSRGGLAGLVVSYVLGGSAGDLDAMTNALVGRVAGMSNQRRDDVWAMVRSALLALRIEAIRACEKAIKDAIRRAIAEQAGPAAQAPGSVRPPAHISPVAVDTRERASACHGLSESDLREKAAAAPAAPGPEQSLAVDTPWPRPEGDVTEQYLIESQNPDTGAWQGMWTLQLRGDDAGGVVDFAEANQTSGGYTVEAGTTEAEVTTAYPSEYGAPMVNPWRFTLGSDGAGGLSGTVRSSFAPGPYDDPDSAAASRAGTTFEVRGLKR